MLLQTATHAGALRALSALTHHAAFSEHSDPTELATDPDVLEHVATRFLVDLLALLDAAGIDPGEVMGHASDTFDTELAAAHSQCQRCATALDPDDQRETCDACTDEATGRSGRSAIRC